MKKDASGHYTGTFYYRTADGNTGQLPMAQQKHVTAPVLTLMSATFLHQEDCYSYPSENPGEPDVVCCLCGPWHYNCTESDPNAPIANRKDQNPKVAVAPKSR